METAAVSDRVGKAIPADQPLGLKLPDEGKHSERIKLAFSLYSIIAWDLGQHSVLLKVFSPDKNNFLRAVPACTDLAWG